jgi:hypothetical protein
VLYVHPIGVGVPAADPIRPAAPGRKMRFAALPPRRNVPRREAEMTIDPNPDLVESLQERFSQGGPDGVYAFASGWMSAMIVRAAKGHAEHCADCQTCHDLSELLSAVAAIQIMNPPTDLLGPVRDVKRPVAGSGIARGLPAVSVLGEGWMPFSLPGLIAIAVAVVLVFRLLGGL